MDRDTEREQGQEIIRRTLARFGKSSHAELIDLVPRGFYVDGSVMGGVIKQTNTVRYKTDLSPKTGKWAVSKTVNLGFSKYSAEEYETPLDAAIALDGHKVKFTRNWLLQPVSSTVQAEVDRDISSAPGPLM